MCLSRLPVGAVSNYVYKLKYGRAEIIGGVLTQLYGGQGGAFGQNNPFLSAGQRFQGSGSQFNTFGSGGGGLGGSYGLAGGEREAQERRRHRKSRTL